MFTIGSFGMACPLVIGVTVVWRHLRNFDLKSNFGSAAARLSDSTCNDLIFAGIDEAEDVDPILGSVH